MRIGRRRFIPERELARFLTAAERFQQAGEAYARRRHSRRSMRFVGLRELSGPSKSRRASRENN
jgi:hypothetical protein